MRHGNRVRAALLAPALALAFLVGCGGEGTKTSCNLNSCTVTFDRGVDAKASVLGVEAKLVGVQNDQATIEIGGQQVTIPVGGQAQANGFDVSVQQITADQVTLQISNN
jgi:hypothetical protein